MQKPAICTFKCKKYDPTRNWFYTKLEMEQNVVEVDFPKATLELTKQTNRGIQQLRSSFLF